MHRQPNTWYSLPTRSAVFFLCWICITVVSVGKDTSPRLLHCGRKTRLSLAAPLPLSPLACTGSVPCRSSGAHFRHGLRARNPLPQCQPRAEAPGQRVEVAHLRAFLGVCQRRVHHVRRHHQEGRGYGYGRCSWKSVVYVAVRQQRNNRVPPQSGFTDWCCSN